MFFNALSSFPLVNFECNSEFTSLKFSLPLISRTVVLTSTILIGVLLSLSIWIITSLPSTFELVETALIVIDPVLS
ncbi:hypothetical protein [Mesoplasma melaleucae]|uniref:Uncharacterized protein n=1 Tax=Mesoplasma melaleucae TaxID=81459 RepID=A0A2K8NWM3_9MOLU|nr:hypothetical protein [Mesoplasma melaleucae]ATZ18134.1 hypothetical protein EMELA_v1c06230 [Mesoplasma melaleucae]